MKYDIFVGFYNNIFLFHGLWSQRLLRMMGIYLVWHAYIKHNAYTFWCGDYKPIHHHKSIRYTYILGSFSWVKIQSKSFCTSHPFTVWKNSCRLLGCFWTINPVVPCHHRIFLGPAAAQGWKWQPGSAGVRVINKHSWTGMFLGRVYSSKLPLLAGNAIAMLVYWSIADGILATLYCLHKCWPTKPSFTDMSHQSKSNKTNPVSISISDRSSCMALYGVEKLILHNVNLVGGWVSTPLKNMLVIMDI